MYNPQLAQILYNELLKIARNTELAPSGKIAQLHDLLILVINEAVKDEKIQFNTLFAKIAYACNRNKIGSKSQFYIHRFRKIARSETAVGDPDNVDLDVQLGIKVIAETILSIFEAGMPDELIELLPAENFYTVSPVPIVSFKPKVRVLALENDHTLQQLLVVPEDEPEKVIRLQYNIPERNENFNPSIKVLVDHVGFPSILQLIDVAIDEQEHYRPAAIVIEPDYLVDVTSVAECFREGGTEPLGHILKKFLPFESTKAITIGNMANMFLDELMANANIGYDELFVKAFKQTPFAFIFWEDADVKEVRQEAHVHYLTLQKMVQTDFLQQNIIVEDCFLEPTFYSETYGLQGRLDVFYQNKINDKKGAIVELKSSKIFKPNSNGLNHSHYYQTLLYDLLIKSAFGFQMDAINYILYSRYADYPLRYSPTSKTQQFEALQLRNQVVALEKQLAVEHTKMDGTANQSLFQQLVHHPMTRGGGGFFTRDLQLFAQVYTQLTAVEQLYFNLFVSFVAKEQQLAKIGVQDIEDSNGTASLWLNTIKEKEDRYEIFNNLTIVENLSNEEDPIIKFQKSADTCRLTNFRDGDIGVLYPSTDTEMSALSNQVFKCTIIKIEEQQIVVRLRSRQFNHSLFRKYKYWNLEHDLLDTSFNGMYRQLFEWAKSDKSKRDLWIGARPPRESVPGVVPDYAELLPAQQTILSKMLASRDYFLLWGPPGTGKTSIMVKYFVKEIMDHTEERIMLLAYTNRAVDEICESIENIRPEIRDQYFRIGSKYSTAANFQPQLLDHKITNITNRKDLKELIANHRIVVATVSSIVSKPEVLQLMGCTRIVIDEASQILEPMLVGLLTRFEKVILIGDHLQLPAVVVQDPKLSKVDDAGLAEVCLTDLRDSLFERLYRLCRKKDWHWAYSQLQSQGRMHQSLMQFPGEKFYDGTLQALPPIVSDKQYLPLSYKIHETASQLVQAIASRRLLYLETEADLSSVRRKTNQYEALAILQILQAFFEIYTASGKTVHERSIGIITPYRAQIAKIKDLLLEHGINLDLVTIDTVERYQGGARDIIVLSLCTNHESQLASLASLSSEGVDRKLNVALTRAKEQIVLIGNKEILMKSANYRALLQTYYPIDPTWL